MTRPTGQSGAAGGDRPSLAGDEMAPVWDAVRRRLERQGLDNRGRVRLPDVPANARLTVQALTRRRSSTTVDLARLEEALRRLGVGADLPSALAALGHPVSTAAAERRAERKAAASAREVARAEAATWDEPWRDEWIDGVIRAGGMRGLDAAGAVALVRSVRTILDALDSGGTPGTLDGHDSGGSPGTLDGPGTVDDHDGREAAASPTTRSVVSRVDLAARLFGSSHALDTGTRLEAATTRALELRQGAADPRDLWERSGAHLDLTSGPALTWRLPLRADSPLTGLAEQATALGVPLHLTQLALRRHPVAATPGADVLVAENPRVVEAAAQMDVPTPVVAANGNPSGAVRLLLDQLAESGARLRYHGDFDAAGLAICGRMAGIGLVPWRMTAADYEAAVERACAARVTLSHEPAPAPPTPWDEALRIAFDRHRLVVHEERLLPDLLHA